MAKLTDKQERFVQELIKGKSQREAYRIAYPKSLKWADGAVDTQASILFKNSKVLERYNEIHDRLIKEAEDECILDAKDILKELVKIAFSNGSDFAKVVTKPSKRRYWDDDLKEYVYEDSVDQYDQFVELVDTDQLPDKKKAAIATIKTTRHGISVESYDKVKALELLGRHMGLFKDKVEVTGNIETNSSNLSEEELDKEIEKLRSELGLNSDG